jgi:hypothetical protein
MVVAVCVCAHGRRRILAFGPKRGSTDWPDDSVVALCLRVTMVREKSHDNCVWQAKDEM